MRKGSLTSSMAKMFSPTLTLKRQWMLVLTIFAVITVCVNTIVLSMLIDRYFVEYSTKGYERNITQLTDFARSVLTEPGYGWRQSEVQLEALLVDPIIRIRLYDISGNLLVDLSSERNRINGMMRNKMMARMMGGQEEETDLIDVGLPTSGMSIGKLAVTRYSSIGNSFESGRFKMALIASSLLSFAMVLVFVLLTGIIASRKMSKELIQTAKLAGDMELENKMEFQHSGILEIRTIQQSLESFQNRLRLKQTSRKKLVDELLHQTRTPLTILKTHLEAIQDGVIDLSNEEIRTCEAQLENLESIISNMSGMIDAEKELDCLKPEEFELSQLLHQIVAGLSVQFERKGLKLVQLNHRKTILNTDKYKLSQCIYNLLTNAYKYTDKDGTVTIDYQIEQEWLYLKISDTGVGISDLDRERIFEAYYSGSQNDKNSEGIGLYIVKQNLDLLGGSIEVSSEPGRGSEFTIKLLL